MAQQIGPQSIPFNRVVALDLQRDLALEFAKKTWRDGYATALARWIAEGHVITRVPSTTTRKPRFSYSE